MCRARARRYSPAMNRTVSMAALLLALSCGGEESECEVGCVNGECAESGGEPSCKCDNGWKGASCEDDVDECAGVYTCPVDHVCENTDGTYLCVEED